MPPGRPRKRPRPSDSQSAPSPASTANPSVATSSPSHPSTSFVSTDDDTDLPPFLNTTFSTHRLSPLYIGARPLTQDRLHTLSQRLRDLLVGDVVRGVEVGLDRGADDGAMRRAGALEAVAIGWVRLEGLLGRYVGGEEEEGGAVSGGLESDGADMSGLSAEGSPGKRRALQISLRYENAECAALLLPPSKSQPNDSRAQAKAASTSLFNLGSGRPDENDPEFLHLPLLLLRMPAPLKAVISDFLSRSFDCRISSLSLGTRSMVRALERWIGDSGAPTNGQFAKDVVLTLGFYGPTVTQNQRMQTEATDERGLDGDEEDLGRRSENLVGIKTIDVIIPNTDLRLFLRAGTAFEVEQNGALGQGQGKRKQRHDANFQRDSSLDKRRRLGGDKEEEGWTWRRWTQTMEQEPEKFRPQPFLEALAQYVQKHLALDMFHPAVRIAKVACGGFALSEGRVKIFGALPTSEDDGGLSDTKQRAVWGVMEGLLERAQLKVFEQALDGTTA
ncbi:hypothetical protein VP1G_08767 [Cytospora mali]|uniref:Siroheme synthase n=1 Tax=Cytospora mali TaxID=578113 RepID=A0A194VC66_CYTMA|nr:hypothetical protein VP1G_08767 [Valsa mali var. pyri (nom. inval.)]